MQRKGKVQREKCSSTKNAESVASKLLDSTIASLAVMHAKESGSNNSNIYVYQTDRTMLPTRKSRVHLEHFVIE